LIFKNGLFHPTEYRAGIFETFGHPEITICAGRCNKTCFSSSSLRSHIWWYPEKLSNNAIVSHPNVESTTLSTLDIWKSSFGQHLLRSVKSVNIHHLPFFFLTITTFANQLGYRTSCMNRASNSLCTSAFVADTFSSDILQGFYFLGLAVGLTWSLCSIMSLLTPVRSEVCHAKTSLFLSKNESESAFSFDERS
jgi:hypothetical protein